MSVEESDNNLFSVSIVNEICPITTKVLYKVFFQYGPIEGIFRHKKLPALVQFFCYEDANCAIEALDGKLIYDECCRIDIDFINISLWDVHNNKGIEVLSTIVPSVVTQSILHDVSSAQEPSAYEQPTQSTLVPLQSIIRPSDSGQVDSSLSFRTSKLDSSPQTHLNPDPFSSPGFQSAISKLVNVANDGHASKINVDLSMNSSYLVQKTFAEIFKRETISNGWFDFALLITFKLVRNGNLVFGLI
ncbi:hypothetical protein Dimus_039198 [Dionaea muscipula]